MFHEAASGLMTHPTTVEESQPFRHGCFESKPAGQCTGSSRKLSVTYSGCLSGSHRQGFSKRSLHSGSISQVCPCRAGCHHRLPLCLATPGSVAGGSRLRGRCDDCSGAAPLTDQGSFRGAEGLLWQEACASHDADKVHICLQPPQVVQGGWKVLHRLHNKTR